MADGTGRATILKITSRRMIASHISLHHMQPTLPLESKAKLVHEAFGKTPFLDLSWHFNAVVNFEDRRQRLRKLEPTVELGMKFKEYAAQERAKRSKLAQFFAKDADKATLALDNMELRAEYIVGLSPAGPVGVVLIKYYVRLADFVKSLYSPNSARSALPEVLPSLFLDPTLKWCGHDEVDESVAKSILEQLESVIDATDEYIKSEGVDAESLELQNNLICCYWVIAKALRHGVSSAVLTNHLLIYASVEFRVGGIVWFFA